MARRKYLERGRAEQIIREAAEGILTYDQRGQLLAVNLAAERLFGYRSAVPGLSQ